MRAGLLVLIILGSLTLVALAPSAEAAATCNAVQDPTCPGIYCIGQDQYGDWQYCVPPQPCRPPVICGP